MAVPPLLGVVVGLAAEARLAAAVARPALIAASGATTDGARAAAGRLVASGATHLLSFGFAAGLDPTLRPGTVLLPEEVIVDGCAFATDRTLARAFGVGVTAPLLHSDQLVAERDQKRMLCEQSGCAALDMESGAVAVVARNAGLPFAVLRAVCDPAGTTLAPAARVPLHSDGTVDRIGVLRSILFRPNQLPALMALGRDVRAAQIALRSCLAQVVRSGEAH